MNVWSAPESGTRAELPESPDRIDSVDKVAGDLDDSHCMQHDFQYSGCDQGRPWCWALPSLIGSVRKDLIKCFAMPEFNYGWYLITREALRDMPRVNALNKFIVAHARA